MSTKSGQLAEKSGIFQCIHCAHSVYLNEGDPVPECPCGRSEYERRTDGQATP